MRNACGLPTDFKSMHSARVRVCRSKRCRLAFGALGISKCAKVRVWLGTFLICLAFSHYFSHIFMLCPFSFFYFLWTSKIHHKLKINPNDLQFFALWSSCCLPFCGYWIASCAWSEEWFALGRLDMYTYLTLPCLYLCEMLVFDPMILKFCMLKLDTLLDILVLIWYFYQLSILFYEGAKLVWQFVSHLVMFNLNDVFAMPNDL